MPTPQDVIGNRRQQSYAKQKGRDKRKGLCKGKRLEQFPFLCLHGEDGQEADNGSQHPRAECAGHFLYALINQIGKGFATANDRILPFLNMSQNTFNENHADIDHHPNGNGNARQGDNVCLHARITHNNKGGKDGNGENAGYND
ncbi:hypothetical protein Barb4_00604 [Bacteroidales bacterium Barb4]|nr:hypothetical protein Barb4_00604 [Bacteroidales bacterium Barb4]